MKTEEKVCIFCGHTKLYEVSTSQYRCVACKRTFSHVKYAQDMAILEYFIDNYSAYECASLLGLNYLTIAKKYHKLRLCCLNRSIRTAGSVDIRTVN